LRGKESDAVSVLVRSESVVRQRSGFAIFDQVKLVAVADALSPFPCSHETFHFRFDALNG
jgi:hypothetical protein